MPCADCQRRQSRQKVRVDAHSRSAACLARFPQTLAKSKLSMVHAAGEDGTWLTAGVCR